MGVGGGDVGLEGGEMGGRFGSEVAVVEIGPRLRPREDEDVSDAIADFLAREGIAFRLNATCLSVSRSGGDIVMHVDCADGAPEIRGSHLLIATGRRPSTADVGLERPGVKQDPPGYLIVDDERRTNIPGI